jgi:hypothetical protein
MGLEWEPSFLAGPLDQPIEAFPIERWAALVDEDEGRLRVLPFNFRSARSSRPLIWCVVD